MKVEFLALEVIAHPVIREFLFCICGNCGMTLSSFDI